MGDMRQTFRESKIRLRVKFREERDRLTPEERRQQSEQILTRLYSLPVYQECEELLLYCSIKSEVETEALLFDALSKKKRVYAPKTFGNGRMEFYRIFSADHLKPGRFGVPEPFGRKQTEAEQVTLEQFVFEQREKPVLVVLPGLAFDRTFGRLGYGGGYYDRYLSRLEEAGCRSVTAALAFDIQLTSDLPKEEFDRTVDYLILPGEILQKNG